MIDIDKLNSLVKFAINVIELFPNLLKEAYLKIDIGERAFLEATGND